MFEYKIRNVLGRKLEDYICIFGYGKYGSVSFVFLAL